MFFNSRYIELFHGVYKPTNAELGAHPKWCCFCMVFVSFLETTKPLKYIVTHVWDVFFELLSRQVHLLAKSSILPAITQRCSLGFYIISSHKEKTIQAEILHCYIRIHSCFCICPACPASGAVRCLVGWPADPPSCRCLCWWPLPAGVDTESEICHIKLGNHWRYEHFRTQP